MRFDETITKFLVNDYITCDFCPGKIKMEYDSKMGFYKCGSCNQIKAPRLISKTGAVKLYWTNCPDCKLNNLTEHENEPHWIIRDEKNKIIVKENLNQKKITCSNCNYSFLKTYGE